MKTSFEEIVQVDQIGKNSRTDMNEIFEVAEKEQFKAAVNDSRRRLLLCIDVQNDFIEGGSLEVPASIGDVERITRFIYNNMGGITKIMCSMDTHVMYQIFHPCWWVSPETGKNPDPYTVITYEDVVNNIWRPLIGVKKSMDYLQGLEAAGKKRLCIWPYHCINGTPGHALENQFGKMVYLHSLCRAVNNPMIPKGQDPYSEMYGIIKAEHSEENFINTPVLNAIEHNDEIYVVGEAASHCLMESVKQIAEHFENRPEITQRITILEDCTSPIKGCEADTAAAFANFKNSYGIKFAKSTDIQL